MLGRMYTRWAERRKMKVELVDYHAGEQAGIKSVTYLLKGENAYGYAKTESGVHRLVRISPFGSGDKRQTSFASVWVYPVVDENIDIEIVESDLRIDTFRASGAGGQHIKHHRLGSAHHAYPDQHRRPVPEPAQPAQEQGGGDEPAARAPL